MKNIFALIVLSFVFYSCAVKVPYTRQVKEEFGLKSEEKMRKVQFFTSSTIILNQVAESSSETMTDESGTLVSSSTSESESLIIQANTRCIFEVGDEGSRTQLAVPSRRPRPRDGRARGRPACPTGLQSSHRHSSSSPRILRSLRWSLCSWAP